MGWLSDLTGTLFGGQGVSTPYSADNAPLFNQLQSQTTGLGQFFDPQGLMNSFNSNSQLEQSAGILSGFDPNSFFQGANGIFGQAAQAAGGDQLGAQGYFKNVLQPGFTDVMGDPQLQAAMAALTNQSQQFLNQNADVVNASAQRASGGTGAGTAGANQMSNLVSHVGQNLSDQQAQLMLGELARKQGIQQSAAQQGLGFGLNQAQALGGLGAQMGSLGQAQGGLALGQANALQGLGQLNQQNLMQQQMLPLQQQQALAALLQGQTTSSPGLYDGAEKVAKGSGALMTVMSDKRVKTDIQNNSKGIEEFLNSLKAYTYRYIGDGKVNHGIMAQDLEESEVGKSLVHETDGGKVIDVALSVGAILAAIGELNLRLKKLEVEHG